MNHQEILVKRIGLVGVASLLVELHGLILLPVLTKNLSISDYGIWVQVGVTIGLVPAIALLGLPYTMVRFLAPASSLEDIREIFYTLAIIIVLAGFAVSTLIFIFAEPLSAALFNGDRTIVQILSLIVFLECLNGITFNYFMSRQQVKKYATFLAIRICLIVFLVIFFVLSGRGIYGAMFGLLITALIIFVSMTAFVISDIGLTIPKFRNIREYIAFGTPTVPGNLSSWVVNSSDRYVIGWLLSSAAVGYYSPGYTLGNIIIMFITPLSLLLPATLSKHYDNHQTDEVRFILGVSLKYFLAMSIPSAFGLSLLSQPILAELSTPELASQGYLITPFVAISTIFLGAYAIISQVIILEKRTSLTGAIWIVAAAVNLVLNFALIPFMGILGAAIATLLAFAFAFAATTYYSTKYLKFGFDIHFITKSTFASGVMSLLIIVFNPEGTLSLILAVVLAAILYFGVLILVKGITLQEIDFIKGLL